MIAAFDLFLIICQEGIYNCVNYSSVIGGKAPALLKKLSLRDLRDEHVGRRKSLCATAK